MSDFEVNERRRDLLKFSGAGSLALGSTLAFSNTTALAADARSTFFNVIDFGAVGDGSTNDRLAIEAAIDAASSPEGSESVQNMAGGVVFLPAGNYLVDSIKMRRNVTLMGEGPATIITQQDSINAAVIVPSTEREYPLIIQDLRIRGARSPANGGTKARGIALNTTHSYGGFTSPDGQHIISQVWIERSYAEGIYVAKDCRGTLIKDCWVKSSATSSGIHIAGSDSTIVNTVSRSHAGAGYYIDAGNVRMINNKAFFCGGGGFIIKGGRSHLSVCEAQDNWLDGFRITANDTLISGCLADSNQQAGFHIDPEGGWLGGICMTGVLALGRPEQQASKPWIGQEIGIRIGPGNINDSYFAGITRKNTEQLVIDAQLNKASQWQGIVVG
jgi:hypothetical protein